MLRTLQKQKERIRAAQAIVAFYEDEESRFLEAVAFIRGPDAIEPAERVAAVCRVSTAGQEKDGSLDRQEVGVCAKVEGLGASAETLWKGVMAGDSEEFFRVLESAFREAGERGFKKVVFATLSRLVRSEEYARGNLRARPSPEQLGRIRRLAEMHGLTVITLCRPDAPFREEKSFLTRLSGCCGRPKGTANRKPGWCRVRGERFKEVALAAVDAGKSYRKAAKVANDAMREAGCLVRGVSHETVRLWDLGRKAGGK